MEADSVKILLVSLQKLSLVQLEIVLANFSLKSLPFNMFSSMKIYTKFELYPGFTLTSFRTHCPWSRGFASFFHNSIFLFRVNHHCSILLDSSHCYCFSQTVTQLEFVSNYSN